jgi:hypothetical protein
VHGVQQIANGAVGFEGVSEMDILVHVIDIAPPLFFCREYTGLDQFPHDALYGPFGDAHIDRDLPHGEMGVAGETDEHVGIVAQKGPGMLVLIHEINFVNENADVKTEVVSSIR